MLQNILVVDDEDDVRNLMVAVLSEAGYSVIDINSAVGIVDQVRASRPDLIILDLTMPVVDGFSALHQLKTDPGLANIPVVIASAQAQKETLIRARDLGAADFIIKPWADGEVEWRVGSIFGLIEDAA